MGKQIGFIMDDDDEMKFFNFIKNYGTVIFESTNAEPKPIVNLPDKESEKGWFQLYLHKEIFGKITYTINSRGFKYINPINAPVIEF